MAVSLNLAHTEGSQTDFSEMPETCASFSYDRAYIYLHCDTSDGTKADIMVTCDWNSGKKIFWHNSDHIAQNGTQSRNCSLQFHLYDVLGSK